MGITFYLLHKKSYSYVWRLQQDTIRKIVEKRLLINVLETFHNFNDTLRARESAIKV